MKKFRILCVGVLLALATAATFAQAVPPYDIDVIFSPPLTGGTPATYNFYVDDCAQTGPLAAPRATVTPGETLLAEITVNGTYEMCVRAVNATAEYSGPITVATVVIEDLPPPGPVEGFDINVTCRDGGGAVIPCAGSGVTVTVTVN